MKTLVYTLKVLLLLIFAYPVAAQSWTEQTSGLDSVLTHVHFINPDTGYVSGASGIILKTENGGTSWSLQTSGVSDGLALIQFTDANNGYASGGFVGGAAMNCRLIKTTNSGTSWTDVIVNPTKCAGGMYFIHADTGFIAYADTLYGASVIARTTNGGSSWTTVHTSPGWISYFHFVDSQYGFATVNNGTILKTSDGGQTWNVSTLPTSLWASGLYFFDKDLGIIGGGPPGVTTSMYKTTNAGTIWTPITSDKMIFKINFANNLIGYALSVDTTGAGKVLKSTNGGDSWADEITPRGNIRGIQFLNPNLGYAVGDSGVILKYAMPTGIEGNISKENTITVYPNPTSDHIFVMLQSTGNPTGDLKIFDLMGKLMLSQNLTQKVNEVQLDALEMGVYLFMIRQDDKISQQKIIISR